MQIESEVQERPPVRIGPADWSEAAGARQVHARITISMPPREDGIASLADLYDKATHSQWRADDLDWSPEFDPDNPLDMHDGTIPLSATPLWGRLGEADKALLRRRLQAWHLSQILHGERASMLCASKIMLSSDDPAEKRCAAVQASDEARHVDVYSRLLGKVGPEVDISPSLNRLLFSVLHDNDPGITSLGMQIMIEGIALAFFKNLQAYSNNPLAREVIGLVIRDEARHFAAGQMGLARIHSQLTGAELRLRESYVIEACSLLDDYLFADELWEPLGMKKSECVELTRASPVSRSMHRSLFRNVVPAIRSIGLLGDYTRSALDRMGVLGYAAFPSV